MSPDFTARVLAAGLRRPALARGIQRRLPAGRTRNEWPIDARRSLLAPGGGRRSRCEDAPAAGARQLCAGTHSWNSRSSRASVGETQRLLHAMGFAPVGTASDQAGDSMWRQRMMSACCLERRCLRPPPESPRSALESADPGAVRPSAPRGCWPRSSSRQRGPDEAELSAVAAPDGTSVFFCRTDERVPDGPGWLEDFEPLCASTGGAVHGTGPDRPRRTWRSRSTISTRRCCSIGRCWASSRSRASNLRRRHGLVRSRAVTNDPAAASGSLSTCPVARSGHALWRSGLQHVAFECDGRALRRWASTCAPRGLVCTLHPGQLLRRPRRSGGISSRACSTAMRGLDVLYDRAQTGGEFLHLSTRRRSAGGCSSRSSSGEVVMRATGPQTPGVLRNEPPHPNGRPEERRRRRDSGDHEG